MNKSRRISGLYFCFFAALPRFQFLRFQFSIATLHVVIICSAIYSDFQFEGASCEINFLLSDFFLMFEWWMESRMA